MGPICAPKSEVSSTPMPMPARTPPQRLMKVGCGAGAPGAAAGCGCAGFAGVALGAALRVVFGDAGTERWRPRLPPPPKRLAASTSAAASINARAAIATGRNLFMRS